MKSGDKIKNFFMGIPILLTIFSTFAATNLPAEISAKEDIQEKICLNGAWQVVTGKGLSELPKNGWWDSQVPKDFYSTAIGEASYGWAKRQIDIPSSWQNRRVFIRFNSCRFNPHVYIDGKIMGERTDGWTPFDVEITSIVQPGSTHWLQLRCQDQTATYADGFRIEQGQPHDSIRGKVLAPIGGGGFFGPMDDVWLFSRPNTYLDDIAIVTSTRNKTITISGIVLGSMKDNLWVEGKVFDKNKVALEIPASPVKDNKWQISSIFKNAKYWSPENPHLYKLQLNLRKSKDGEIIDTPKERFGFKEFWTDGPDFYLNGVKRHLLGSGCWPISEVDSHEKIREKLEAVKTANITTFRYHVQPWPKRWVEIADELGIMIIDEAAVYTDQVGMYAYNDERFWENYRKHLEGLIKRDRNNASVIIWSIENELLHMGMTRFSEDLPKKLGDLGRFVKELDPSRPIIFDGDLDPDGAADIIGLHYPHEPPTYSDWPNTADWLEKRIELAGSGGMLGVTRRDFSWIKTKPLYIGEYLWMPFGDYSSGTIFFGDTAYTNKNLYHDKAKLQAWIDQTIAYRRTGLSGMCPWSCFRHGVIVDDLMRPFYEAQKEFYKPIVAFMQNRDKRFFSGNYVERTFDIFNDSSSDVNLTLKWCLSNTNITGEEKLTLEPGGYKLVTINFIAPNVNKSTNLEFQAELTADGKQANTIKEIYTIEKLKPITAPDNTDVLLYDPGNNFHKKIPAVKTIDSLNSLKNVNIEDALLIIAPQITEKEVENQIGKATLNSKELLEFLQKGGKVIVLEQETLNGLGLGLSLRQKNSTMTFALNKNHPVLQGITEEDLKFWKNDNYLTNHEIVRPNAYGARAIIVSGSDRALDKAPITEISVGKGSILLIQALLGQKMDYEPPARRILQNSINYMASKPINENNTVVFGSDIKFEEDLSKLELNYTPLKGLLTNNKLKNADILILHGGGREITQSKKAIKNFLRNSTNKTVYWHCPDKETFEELKDILVADSLEITSAQGPIYIASRDNKLLSGISREDLLFLTEPSQGWRRRINLDTSVINNTLMPKVINKSKQKFEIEAETLEMKGNVVHLENSNTAVMFKSMGAVEGFVDIPQSGIYLLSLIAGSRESRGIYPQVEIKVADEIVGQITTSQNEIREYPFLAKLPAGKNKLEISFINGPDWGGGIALLLDKLVIGERVNIPENVEFFTLPAALASINIKGNIVIIDNIKWDSNDNNMVKGYRYASALLANLGASFEINKKGDITWLGLENFELVGESPYFWKTPDQLNLNSDGTVAADFNCVKKGEYSVFLKGSSTPVKGKYALVKILMDNKLVGRKVISSSSSNEFKVGTIKIIKGKHKISVSFVNDLLEDGQDRNLYIEGVGFRKN